MHWFVALVVAFKKRTVGEGTKSNGLWGTIEFFYSDADPCKSQALRLWCIQADEECHYDVKGHTAV